MYIIHFNSSFFHPLVFPASLLFRSTLTLNSSTLWPRRLRVWPVVNQTQGSCSHAPSRIIPGEWPFRDASLVNHVCGHFPPSTFEQYPEAWGPLCKDLVKLYLPEEADFGVPN